MGFNWILTTIFNGLFQMLVVQSHAFGTGPRPFTPHGENLRWTALGSLWGQPFGFWVGVNNGLGNHRHSILDVPKSTRTTRTLVAMGHHWISLTDGLTIVSESGSRPFYMDQRLNHAYIYIYIWLYVAWSPSVHRLVAVVNLILLVEILNFVGLKLPFRWFYFLKTMKITKNSPILPLIFSLKALKSL